MNPSEDFTFEEWLCERGHRGRGMTPTRCPQCGAATRVQHLETDETVIIKDGVHIFLPKE